MILDDTEWGSLVEPATGSGTFEVVSYLSKGEKIMWSIKTVLDIPWKSTSLILVNIKKTRCADTQCL